MFSYKNHYEAWPPFSYPDFQSTGYLLHRAAQMLGKLKLMTPFEPHWANVALWPTSTGVTTGVIPYGSEAFSIDIDCINHQILMTTSWGKKDFLALQSTSVAALYHDLFQKLTALDIDIHINPKPQEIPNPILFNEDTEKLAYDADLANRWWHILMSSYHVMQRYHSRFKGITPPIGLMWGTFDLRDARYRNTSVPVSQENAGFLRRNAMDVVQVESGWWSGNDQYPRSAYYSFTFPKPLEIEKSIIQPKAAHWDAKMSEFILDYDDLRKTKNPAIELLTFFDSTYNAGAYSLNWEKDLLGAGVPV